MKKLLSIMLALVMILSLATTAFAADGDQPTTLPGYIENANPEDGAIYNVYMMFELESYATNDKGVADENTPHSYTVAEAWEGFLYRENNQTAGAGAAFFDLDANGYVTAKENASAADIAAAAKEYAKNLASSDVTFPLKDENGDPVLVEGKKVYSKDVALGYYLVDSTLGALCSLDTTHPSATIEEKNEAPSVTKKVQEDSDGSWGESNNADFNQNVTFESYITVKKGAENYILHDKMDLGLTFKNYVAVYYYEPVVSDKGEVTYPGDRVDVAPSNYEVITAHECAPEGECALAHVCAEGCTFEVKFKNEWISSLALETKIVVEYTAYLNHNAVVGNIGNTNKVWLQYGDENHPSYTPKDSTITYTGQLGIYKYTKNAENKNVPLPGAEFELKLVDGQNLVDIRFHVISDANGKVQWYEVCHTDNKDCGILAKDHVTKLVSSANADNNPPYNIKIEGLDAGTYHLIETKAPDGYNKLAEAKVLEVPNKNENGSFNYNIVRVEVENNAGTELPETGGMGTTLIYTLGAILAVGSLILLVVKKRMAAAE